MSINQVAIAGNVVRDPELREGAAGSCALSLTVAVDDRRRNADTGEWESVPNYVDVVMFGSRARALAGRLAKGAKVAVAGKLRWQSWERDGQTRTKLDVIADEVECLSARGDG